MFNKSKTFSYLIIVYLILTFSISFSQKQNDNSWTKDFRVDKNEFLPFGSNPFFILKPGYQLILNGKEDGEDVVLLITVLDQTKVIDEVETAIVEERESRNGKLVEVSKNYFAISKSNNSVFYFGEDVDIHKNDIVINHGGSWTSGDNNAKFGLMMPGIFLLGSKYYQEIAPEVALDRAEISSVNKTLETPAGSFIECLETEETTPLESGVEEFKVYAPGIGLIKDGSLLLVKYGFVHD